MFGSPKQLPPNLTNLAAWLRRRATGHSTEYDLMVYARPATWLALAEKIDNLGKADPQEKVPFWPVGNIQSASQLAQELIIAGERLQLQAGVMNDWSQRFIALAKALQSIMPSENDGQDG